MTTQNNLGLVWAISGGTTDPGDAKYQAGWVAEIPTFQNFNFVLQNATLNALSQAEKGANEWDATINYVAGATIKYNGDILTCITDHINQNPATDSTYSYWVLGASIGGSDTLVSQHGLLLKSLSAPGAVGVWTGSAMTVEDTQALVQFNTDNPATKNLMLGNVQGSAVVVDIDTTEIADGRDISLTDANTHKIFHEGNPPTLADVGDSFPDANSDGRIYGRKDAAWIQVTTTTVSIAPPPPVEGTGQGWYNLDDGQFYIDINDGDSSQWVPGNPPVIPNGIGGAGDGGLNTIEVAAGLVKTGTATDPILGLDYSIVTSTPIDVGSTADGHLFFVVEAV